MDGEEDKLGELAGPCERRTVCGESLQVHVVKNQVWYELCLDYEHVD